ncbi:MAG: extracellular solute-binding protein [Candidatus Andersenbacteria bacterium]
MLPRLPVNRRVRRALALVASLGVPLVLSACGAPKADATKIVWWDVFDDPSAFTSMIRSYDDAHNVDIELVSKPFDTYEQELVDAIAAGRGPDILSFHNTWLPEHIELLAPLPVADDFATLPADQKKTAQDRAAQLPGLRDFSTSYVDTVSNDFVSNGRIYAMPEYVDSLALYYNEDLLSSSGIVQPPRTWSEFSADAAKLTKLDDQGHVLRAGAAMGAARNINRSTDILSALMLQNGAAAVDNTRKFAAFDREVEQAGNQKYNPGMDALNFYTDFANPTKPSYSWSLDANVWYSLDSFAAGDVAMMLNYSHQVPEVRAANAKLNFKVAPLPQRDDAKFDTTYANYWGLAVSRGSISLDAWEFINFLQRDDQQLGLPAGHAAAARQAFIIPAFENDLNLGVFADQAAVARTAYTPDLSLTETVLANAIDDVNLGRRSASEALNVAASQVAERLRTREFPPIGVSTSAQ